MAIGTAYAKRWGGNFADGSGGGTPIDSTFLNAVETALLQLIGSAPTADGQVAQWDFANTRFGPALLLNKNIDPAAAIAKSKLDFTGANGIVNADIAGAAAISPSKIAGGVPKITSSLMSGGPPGSPVDGDIWIALAVDTGNLATTTGITWAFRYNASSGSAYKWEFIGGSPLGLDNLTSFAMSNGGTYTAFSTTPLQFTLARGGDYVVRADMWATAPNPAGGTVFLGLYDETATALVRGFAGQMAATNNQNFVVAGTYEQAAITAGHVYSLRYNSNAAHVHQGTRFEVQPVRVS